MTQNEISPAIQSELSAHGDAMAAPFVPDPELARLMDNPVWAQLVRDTTSEIGRYEVRFTFRYGNARLQSHRTVTARTRQDAIASVEGGTDASVQQWSYHDPEMVWTRQQLGI